MNIDTTNGTYYTRAGAGGGGGGSSAIWTTDDTLIIAKGGNGGKGGDFGGDIGRLPPQSQSRPIWGWFEGASGGAGGGTSSIGGVYSLSDVTANTSAATVTQGAVKITRFTLPLYSITYHFNGGMPTTQVGEYYSIATTPTTVTLPSVTCQGFGFGGWYDNATFSGAPVTSFPIADKINKEFFAKWTAYTLYISYNNGSDEALGLSPSPAAALYGNTVIIPANPYTREHFKFYGWRVTGDGAGGVVIGAGEYTTANALSTALATKSTSVTLTAVWIPEEVFTITYHLDGGAPTAPLTETYTEFETGIVPLPSLTKTGYTFDGWYADETFTEQIFECEIPDPKGSPDDTIDIWAKFTIDTFDVDFVVGNGDTIDPQTVDYYGTVERPDADPVRDHYTFGGWYADGNFETPYDFDSPVVADLTIYAKWIVDTFAVTFETGAGAAIDNQSVDWNTALKKPTDPIYDGHHVVAWYTDDEFENEYDFETLVTGDLTLWADYAINIYTVSFQTFGGSTVDDQQVEWMDIVIAPDTDPTCAGFIFGGWYTDDEFQTLYDFETPVTGDLTLFAKWNTPTIPPSGGGDGGGFGGVMLAIGIGGGGLVGALVVFVGFKVLISAHKKKKRALKAKAKTAVDNARSSMTDALEQVTKSKSYTDDTEQQQIAMAALAAASKKMAEANTLVKKYKKEEKADE